MGSINDWCAGYKYRLFASIAAGDRATALKTLTDLIKDGVEFPEKKEAAKLLDRLQSGE